MTITAKPLTRPVLEVAAQEIDDRLSRLSLVAVPLVGVGVDALGNLKTVGPYQAKVERPDGETRSSVGRPGDPCC